VQSRRQIVVNEPGQIHRRQDWHVRKLSSHLHNVSIGEHWQAGAMSRTLPWLSEIQPDLFIMIGTELAQERGIKTAKPPRSLLRAAKFALSPLSRRA